MIKPADGRSRVVIEEIEPRVNGGRHPARRVVGDEVVVRAAIFADGHDRVRARLLYKHAKEKRWRFVPMAAAVNDAWSGSFTVDRLGMWEYSLLGWVDHFTTWVGDLRKRVEAQAVAGADPTRTTISQLSAFSHQLDAVTATGGDHPTLTAQNAVRMGHGAAGEPTQTGAGDVALALRTGAILLEHAAARARGGDARKLAEAARRLNALGDENRPYYEFPLTEEQIELGEKYPDLKFATRWEPDMRLWVDRERARFSAWYEMFPRSAAQEPGRHGTFADVEAQLPEIAAMGFDILYLPPVHPIGRAFRKGKNNSVTAAPGDVGSPWAIGDAEAVTAPAHADDHGGHKSIHPALGTFEDFDRLVKATRAHGMEIALDIAFQCSPDHPWVKEHPEWFTIRPDGSIQYAENPPKKYQDIYPLNFESADWRGLWDELYSVFEFWIGHGVLVFRVDNPHTKAMPFWDWCLGSLRAKYPEAIFLAEAFTRPHPMYWLAKVGFTQSYTYFTWRNTKYELESYLEEITRPPVSDFFRPNFWPNTPDILHKTLQEGGRPAFMVRLMLAATLTANWGMYGPAFEVCENAPARPAPGKTESEEYLNSEKYEIRQRERNAPGSLAPLITEVNRIRRENPALQRNDTLRFHATDNSMFLCYSKSAPGNTLLMVVNLDAVYAQSGWTDLDLDALGLRPNEAYFVEDLLTGARYTWRDRRNYVALRPGVQVGHILRIVKQ
ncbi:MAG TPA: alpha-1,4-glucan--maltose-1-phosphate maltosyltransferase [Terracidiphilus sp.]|nr:alpha-1,4-glucan--maltose-1-phosphate maltosyltransferase [Terracidiphilus sp.]